MKNKTSLTILVLLITVLAATATTMGIFSKGGPGLYTTQSIRGKTVPIYGKGLYKDMSAEVAPQGIAQDYVTLFIGIPLLLISLRLAAKGSRRGQYLLTGTLGYFSVTYLFYTVMGMYNALFLVYVALLGTSFYGFLLGLSSFETRNPQAYFQPSTPTKATGGYLIFMSITIGSLWLSIVVPPLLNGTIIPVQVEHYTTLVVQGLDLGLLLPAAFICGMLWRKRRPLAYVLTPVYFIFLSVLMTALSAKVIAMAVLGYNVLLPIVIIPVFNLLTISCTLSILRWVIEQPAVRKKVVYEKPGVA